MTSWIFYILSFLILSACVMDITSRKVTNAFVVFSALLCFALNIYISGLEGISASLLSFVITFVILLPLYMLKVLGGGDFKFFIALSFLLSPLITSDIILYSIVWGSLIGVLQIAFSGQAKQFLYSLYFKWKGLTSRSYSSFKIPYTVAYLLGWLTWYNHGGIL